MQSVWRDLALVCLSPALLIFAFPRFEVSVLAWVGLVPLLLALEGKSLTRAYFLSFAAGVIFFESLFYWIWTVPGWSLVDSLLVHVIYLPQYVALWGLALTWIRKKTSLPLVIVAPPLWVTAEYLRSNASFLSLPWMYLGHSQYAHPSLIQVTSLTGVYGLTFLIVLTNAAIAEAAISLRHRLSLSSISPVPWKAAFLSLAAAGCLLIATLAYGMSVLSPRPGGERITVALIQGNTAQNHKWDKVHRRRILDRHRDLTLRAAQQGAQLVIWPETAVPGDVQHVEELQRGLRSLAAEIKTPLLVGSSENAKFTKRELRDTYQNSMVFFTSEGVMAGEYRKIALVPFAEYVPLRNLVTWPTAIVAATMGDFLPGDQYTVFTTGTIPFSTVICWEVIFPGHFRQFVKGGAAFMVVATNEAWFGDTAAPYQLLAMSAFRAAENRVAIARSANTGISAFIDPFGRITDRLTSRDGKDLFVQGVLIGDVPISRERTFYTLHGDVFAFSLIGISAVMVSLAFLTRFPDPATQGIRGPRRIEGW